MNSGKSPTRRRLLQGAAVAGAAALARPALAQGAQQLRMVMAWPKNFPGLGTSAENFTQRVSNITDGALTIKLYGANELVPAFECFDAVSTGAADLYHGTEYYWQGKSAAFNFFTGIPGGMLAHEMTGWIRHGGGQELWEELTKPFNIKPILAGNSGPQMGGWYNTEITRLSDLRGLKIRMPGLGGEVLRRLGAAAVTMPGAEIFNAMRSGQIDATDWVGPWNDLAFGLYRVAKYYYWPGFHEPSGAISVGVNTHVWDTLKPAHRAAIETACAAENDATYAAFTYYNAEALRTLRNKHKVNLRAFPEAVIEAFARATVDVVTMAGNSDPLARRIHDSYMESLRLAYGWTSVADEPLLAARRLLLAER